MLPVSDLRESLNLVRSRLEDLPQNDETVAACGPALTALGLDITTAIETEFVALVSATAA